MSTAPIRLIMQQYGVDFEAAVLIYEGMSPADARAEVAIKAKRGAEETAITDRFSDWLDRKVVEGVYTPSEVASFKTAGASGNVWEHYQKNIYDTRWDYGTVSVDQMTLEGLRNAYPGFSDDVLRIWLADPSRIPPPETLPQGRLQPDEFEITDVDWKTLQMLPPNRIEDELKRWLDTGYINQYQARDIWDELDYRMRRASATLLATGYTEEEWPAEYAKQQAAREAARRAAERAKKYRTPTSYGRRTSFPRKAVPKPFTEYGAGLEEMRVGFAEEMPKTERWRDWFRSKYGRLTEQFEAKPEAERTEKTWREHLEGRRAEIREQWYGLPPYERGERPSVFAPRIKTVAF